MHAVFKHSDMRSIYKYKELRVWYSKMYVLTNQELPLNIYPGEEGFRT